MPRYLQSVTFGMFIRPICRVGLLNFNVVALKHKEYDLLALYDRLCLVAYFEQTFNNFCIAADERQINQCGDYFSIVTIIGCCLPLSNDQNGRRPLNKTVIF